ncbi:MAG: hypothetical protein HFE64_03455 [Lachnospiraceae bacterium]|jgi:geranylgeranyl pyrophosphate synthase|nr:hypothetical protein [Lachnospiraceae bacterium]
MDWSTIIVAALALIGTIAGSYFANNKTTAVLEVRLKAVEAASEARFNALESAFEARFKALEEKVNKHNQVVERTAIAEQSLKAAWRQIDEIKEDIKK